MKEDVRNLCISYRLSISSTFSRYIYENIIVEKLREITDRLAPKSIGLYYPIKGEVDIRPLITYFIGIKMKVFFPIIKDKLLKWGELHSWADGYLNDMGIWEPMNLSEEIPEVVLVPGVAFDYQGFRIGYGGGFFDRFFAMNPVLGIGVTFDRCFFPYFSFVEDHDVRLGLVVSEKRIEGEMACLWKKEVRKWK